MSFAPNETNNPKAQYPSGVPAKFDMLGNVQPFAGNTIVAHLPSSSPLYPELLKMYEALQTSDLSHLYVLLPPSSWHVTLFEGVCDQNRDPAFWPRDIPLTATVDECTKEFVWKLKDSAEQYQPPLKMRVVGLSRFETVISLKVEVAGNPDDRVIKTMRDELADLLQLQQPTHSSYQLHLTLGYFLKYMSEVEEEDLGELLSMLLTQMLPQEFELGAPEFCRFENMFAYQRLFLLGERP